MTIFLLNALLADGFADTDPSFLRDWLIVLACLVGLAIAIIVLVEKIQGKKAQMVQVSPDPMRTQRVEPVATKRELESAKQEIEDDIKGIRQAIAQDREAAREALGKVHGRIDKVAENTGEMKGELKGIAETMRLLLEKLTK
jgi:hypothetical protein